MDGLEVGMGGMKDRKCKELKGGGKWYEEFKKKVVKGEEVG